MDKLVVAATGGNYALESSWERVGEAVARARLDSAAQLPSFVASLTGDRRGGSGIAEDDELRAGLAASYEVDLWGSVGNRVTAEKFRASASLADYQTAAIGLSAEVALGWYQLTEAMLAKALLEKQVETNETILNLLRARFSSGQISSADVLRQDQFVEFTREQRTLAHVRSELIRNELKFLLGDPAEALPETPEALPRLPGLPSNGIPADLLQRRPDIVSAFALLEAADRDLAAAAADLYPRLELGGDIGSEDFFDSWTYAVFARLAGPVLNRRALGAEVQAAEAARRGLLADFNDTLLRAFRETEDALAQERFQGERLERIERQLELARQTYRQLRVQYLNGVVDYLQVLSALRDEQDLERRLLSERLRLIEFRIALYRSIAGPFPTARETGFGESDWLAQESDGNER